MGWNSHTSVVNVNSKHLQQLVTAAARMDFEYWMHSVWLKAVLGTHGQVYNLDKPKMAKLCAICQEPTRLCCSGCKRLYFCSNEHQIRAWKEGHKASCKENSKASICVDVISLLARDPEAIPDFVRSSYELSDWLQIKSDRLLIRQSHRDIDAPDPPPPPAWHQVQQCCFSHVPEDFFGHNVHVGVLEFLSVVDLLALSVVSKQLHPASHWLLKREEVELSQQLPAWFSPEKPKLDSNQKFKYRLDHRKLSYFPSYAATKQQPCIVQTFGRKNSTSDEISEFLEQTCRLKSVRSAHQEEAGEPCFSRFFLVSDTHVAYVQTLLERQQSTEVLRRLQVQLEVAIEHHQHLFLLHSCV